MLIGGGILPVGLLSAALLARHGSAWWALLVLWAVLGIGTSMISTPSPRLLRRLATDATRSYLFTAQFSLSHACFLLTYPVAGWVGAQAGQSVAALCLAGLAAGGTIAALVLWPAPAASRAAPRAAARPGR